MKREKTVRQSGVRRVVLRFGCEVSQLMGADATSGGAGGCAAVEEAVGSVATPRSICCAGLCGATCHFSRKRPSESIDSMFVFLFLEFGDDDFFFCSSSVPSSFR